MNSISPDSPRNKPFGLTSFQREEICRRYIFGESTVALARSYGVTRAAVRHLLITRGIPRRENTPELHRLYRCNHAYFDEPLDEERAYWIGFLLADGWVSYHRTHTGAPIIGMSLSAIDAFHVERLRDTLQSNHPISYYVATDGYGVGKPMVRFTITSRELVNAVERFGIVAHKTKICATPHLPPELMRHMYRGYVDGDGGLSIRKDGQAALDIVGTQAFLQDFADWLVIHARTHPKSPLKSRNTTAIMNLRYSGLPLVSTVLHVLYDGATISLERKLRMAQDIWFRADN